ncbi:MAG TPA: ABC transporter ATP-binding protein [Alphaproteobacteria bacterium]|nr:ABC transporter ATP-binding protein [Alphaproteobacteria bacterium]
MRLVDLTLGYDGHPAVHHLEGSFTAGSLTAVVGPNGSGKSTLLRGLMGALPPLGGRIEHAHRPERDIAYLPQSAEIDRSFPAPVADLVALGFWTTRGSLAAITAADRRRLADALEAVGLAGFAGRGLDTLSGGQLQRALFARVMVQDAPVILLDEPFAAVDERTVGDLVGIVKRWHGEGRTVIVVLHDLALVRRIFPETLLLAREPIAWGPTAAVLTADNLRRARHMNEAWDERAPWHDDGDGHGHGHDHAPASAEPVP